MSSATDAAIAIVGPGAISTTVAAALHEAGRPHLVCGRLLRAAADSEGAGPRTSPEQAVLGDDPAAEFRLIEIEAQGVWFIELAGFRPPQCAAISAIINSTWPRVTAGVQFSLPHEPVAGGP